ncbi:MAG: C_GCAxxG_C_C family protein [Clostridia bacterium]|nr:C_GCAxxG_C_C family protein [Clostridia bacterium]MBQ5439607.1 C_GCAxxG_C_C family protein [Clostridia bacterium]
MTKGDKAKSYFMNGYNCAQSVALAFCEETGLDEKTAAMITNAYGAGMGGMREVCGTVNGALFVLGCFYSQDPKDPLTRRTLYSKVQEFSRQFEQDNGSIICRELLGMSELGTSKGTPFQRPAGFKKRPCPELVKYTADLLDNYLNEHKK